MSFRSQRCETCSHSTPLAASDECPRCGGPMLPSQSAAPVDYVVSPAAPEASRTLLELEYLTQQKSYNARRETFDEFRTRVAAGERFDLAPGAELLLHEPAEELETVTVEVGDAATAEALATPKLERTDRQQRLVENYYARQARAKEAAGRAYGFAPRGPAAVPSSAAANKARKQKRRAAGRARRK